MKKLPKYLTLFLALVLVLFAGLAIFVGTLNADKYRPQLVEMMSKQTGRVVKLNGPISFSLGFGGVHISIQDASITNPTWASRPLLASMGKLTLGIDVFPLVSHRLAINELSVENADILLETNNAGQHNWDIGNATPTAAAAEIPKASTPATTSSGSSMSISVDKLTIVNSQMAMRSADGKTSSVNIASLNLGMRGTGAELTVKSDVNGQPFTADIKTSVMDLLSKEPFSFDADATFNVLHMAAQGKADIGGGKADISAYEVSAGKSKITGDLAATWNGSRPTLRGTLNSDHLNPADFKLDMTTTDESGSAPSAKSQAEPSSSNKRMFSNTPLPFDALKAVDADLNVAVGEFPVGKDALKQITAKLVLSGGNLVLAPVKASVGASPVDVQVKLNASQSPAHVTVGLIANDVDLGDLQKLGDMSSFMTGKASANVELTGDGNSAHDIASNLGGVITVTAEKGEILTGAASGISSLLAAVFSTAGGDDALNCLAARFIVKNGVLTDNGILVDSAASTVAGGGNVNLGSEAIKMTLRAKTKLVDVGGLVPSMQISGSLSDPHYSVDAASIVNNVVGSLMNGNVDVIGSTVPDIQASPAGQNACVYTLDHPKKASSSGPLSGSNLGTASQKIQNIGKSLMKGMFGQ